MNDDRRLIEDYLRIQAISAEAAGNQNPATRLRHAKREAVAARCFDMPAKANEKAVRKAGRLSGP